jgi:hypothetical protein
MDDTSGLALALEEAKKGYEEGGIPVMSHFVQIKFPKYIYIKNKKAGFV